ncbi:enoyl-CoA hydratase/isomerase family protein [Desulfosoma sp.]
MKTYETLKVTQEGQVLTVRLHRPESKNAINMRMVYDLMDLVDVVTDASDVSVVVFRGSNGCFTSGIDLKDFSLDKPPDIYGLQKWENMCRQVEKLNKFTVAAVEGECIGGGVQLALLCDARIAEKKAVFQLNEVKLGFLPGMAVFRLAKYVGLGRAKNLILTGRRLKAEEALQWGLLDTVSEAVDFEDCVRTTVHRLLPFHPEALELSRRLLNECYAAEYEDFIGRFLAAQHRAITSEAFRQLIVEASKPKSAAKALAGQEGR